MIPHEINASGAGQIWLSDNMGPLSNTMLHLGYYRSEIFSVLWNGGPNAAVVSFTRDLNFPPLTASLHPIDHRLFVAGFQIWGGMAPEISGLARISYIGGATAFPREVLPMKEGILISFHTPVATNSVRPENFSAERWNYRRSHEYGSAHYKLDGTKGQETLFASSTYLSADHKSIFVGIPEMREVMTLRFGWSLAAENGMPLRQNAYLTPRELESFHAGQLGFGAIKVDLTPRTNIVIESAPITAEEGKRLADLMGCVACHSADGSTLGKVGPTWKGLAGSRVSFTDATSALADPEYLRESIQKPTARIVKGFDKSDAGMPSYEGILTDPQIEALILYIQSLR
jgi:cytochrome c551/c552